MTANEPVSSAGKNNCGAALDLLSAQVKSALLDLEQPTRVISECFNLVLGQIDSLQDSLDENRIESAKKQLVAAKHTAGKAIIEFQSFDRVEQRLSHVQKSLNLVADNAQSSESEVLDLIQGTYSIEHERFLHEKLIDGASRDQLLSEFVSMYGLNPEDDIELF